MQYFTFLGLGTKEGYKEVEYQFNGKVIYSSYVQQSIFEEHIDEISEVYVFATKKSVELNGSGLKKVIAELNSNVEVNFIDINANVSFEEIIDLLSTKIKTNFIVDVTHSFRDIPMTVLLSLNYLERSSHCRLLHLYYGKGFAEGPYEIIDFIESYRFSALGSQLDQFQKTLKIDLDFMVENNISDSHLDRFLESIKNFNQMLEFCSFDRSLDAVVKITSCAKKIQSKRTRYKLLIPFVDSIIKMLEPVSKEKDVSLKKVNLINLLLEHRLIQIAITFTDQFIREELIHYTIDNENPKFSIEEIEGKKIIRNMVSSDASLSDCIYRLSQYLILHIYKLRVVNKLKPEQYGDFNSVYKDSIEKNNQILNKLDKSSIDNFYSNIRNMINHGSSINLSYQEIENIIRDSIEIVESLRWNK